VIPNNGLLGSNVGSKLNKWHTVYPVGVTSWHITTPHYCTEVFCGVF